MRSRPLLWFFLSLACFVAGVYFWRLGNRLADERKAPSTLQITNSEGKAQTNSAFQSPGIAPVASRLYAENGNLNSPRNVIPNVGSKQEKPANYRLSNTGLPLRELTRLPSAIILGNALLDTSAGTSLSIPEHLRSGGDPGSYIVQSTRPIDNDFRKQLQLAGAKIISYIPNNAYLVRVDTAGAQRLAGLAQTRSVLPYEPYYKLSAPLLAVAVENKPLPPDATLNLLLFPDSREAALHSLAQIGGIVLGEDRSPFGPVLRVKAAAETLPLLAGLPAVQAIEPAAIRVPASDLSRQVLGVATDPVTNASYLNLTGSNILVNVNDTGVDATHPALAAPRILGDSARSLVDTNGHGTFMAGIIAGSGAESTTVTAQGSPSPSVADQFRGMAPGARIFSMIFTEPDWYLQEMAASTNALISNNSWEYLRTREYDLAAASYDAAVRDSLPLRSGSQPMLYVFPSGNAGLGNQDLSNANHDGLGGLPDAITSPGTAKNVITVGATELMRNMTNQIIDCDSATGVCETNSPWIGVTDSSEQVSGISSRGNVGIGVEGEFGRFKPDLVAPGTFVVSARSTQWDEAAYYGSANRSIDVIPNLIVPTNSFYISGIFIPENAIQLIIRAQAVQPLGADMPIYINNTFVGNNQVLLPQDAPLAPRNDFLEYRIGNGTNQAITFYLQTELVTTNDNGGYNQALRDANEQLGEFYRYESGTSLAAAQVSGVLALMHEFFTTRLQRTNSPALMKALLINGARSASDIYNLQVQNSINYQGWGLLNLTNSLPGSLSNALAESKSSPIFFFDQSPTNALATGQTQTRTIQLSDDARNQPLRATLVWTDPPGNPVAGVKLVNDLNLVVTNLDTGEVYFGNDFQANNDFTLAWDTNNLPNIDVINNVENVYLKEPLGTNYSISVIARHVNVNAVTAHKDDVAQDFALVISSGNGVLTNAITLKDSEMVFRTVPFVTVMTNSLPNNPAARVTGGFLSGQHVGANTPLLGTNTIPLSTGGQLTSGMTNQWHFYALTNEMSFTNAAFVTFMPPTLAVPRMGVFAGDPDNATRLEADIDLYVSTNPGLTNLDPAVIATAFRSTGRGGTEVVALTNALPSTVYYVGVKAEDQQAAEYSFLGIFSENPFGLADENGQTLFGLPVPALIPEGTTQNPQAAQIIALCLQPIKVRRVIVTNTVTHSFPGSLVGTLAHGRKFAVLNNKTCLTDNTGNCITNTVDFIYEDNGEGDIPFSRPSDGPGNLQEFIGEEGVGVWLFNMVNNMPASSGQIDRFLIRLEPQNLGPDNARERDLLPNTWTYDSIDVPPQATNLTVCVSGNTDTVELYVARDYVPTRATYDFRLDVTAPGNCLEIDSFSLPGLAPGRYFIGVYNPSTRTQRIRLTAEVKLNPFAVGTSIPSSLGGDALLDDAVTYSSIFVTNRLSVSDIDVGLLIRHDRISDLAVTLISPNGTRILLFENRGASSTGGLGTSTGITNSSGEPVFAVTNMAAIWTNNFDGSAAGLYAPGARFEGWSVLTNFATVLPDYERFWLSNHVLMPGYSSVSNSLPTTNSTTYRLDYKVSHSPFLAGTVGWWPFEGDARDLFGGFDALICGGGGEFVTPTNFYSMFAPGQVTSAFYGDGVRTSVKVPATPEIDFGSRGLGFTIEGWIRPGADNSSNYFDVSIMQSGFEEATEWGPFFAQRYFAGGWFLEAGEIDVLTNGYGAFPGITAHAGRTLVDINGMAPGTIVTNMAVSPGKSYRLSFAYTGNPDGIVKAGITPTAQVSIDVARVPIAMFETNSWNDLNWRTTSIVFTATSPLARLEVRGLNAGYGGVLFDTFTLTEENRPRSGEPQPIAEWSLASTNAGVSPTQGVQFWLGGTSRTNVSLGSLAAVFWDTNGVSFPLITSTNAITNGGWQHVAMSYDNASQSLRLYANGALVGSRLLPAGAIARTSGDLYFGHHPANLAGISSFSGGLDEFGLYNRALTDCEVNGIFAANRSGKMGAAALACPVAHTLDIITLNGTQTFTLTNGLSWNGFPNWETVSVEFTNPLLIGTNGVGTNLTGIVVRPHDPNLIFDDFVLSAPRTNLLSGYMHFTENTNVTRVPIKFAPWPYATSNFPPQLVFSNGFEAAAKGQYDVGAAIVGQSSPGPTSWFVQAGPVTVVSNSLMDSTGTNWLALARGRVSTEMPTIAGRRYQLSYAVRGPGAVSWWNGDVGVLNGRARDLIGGNQGEFWNGAASGPAGYVGARALYFPGANTNGTSSKIELSDPENLRFDAGFTIETWIHPLVQSNFTGIEQILFRGDDRNCYDPYYLALEPGTAGARNLRLHIDDGVNLVCGTDVFTTDSPVKPDQWQHIAAVFEPYVQIPQAPFVTNQLRLYLNGSLVASNYTGQFPQRNLDPQYLPGVTIGNRSRYDERQPFYGYLDELTLYGRALTGAELSGIYRGGSVGKADLSVGPSQGLAKVRVWVDNAQMDIGYGDNSTWTTRTVFFTANTTNTVLSLEGLLPGTLIDSISLTEYPGELAYLPEESLESLIGESAFGQWTLEVIDTRTGATNNNPELVRWQIDFKLVPGIQPGPVNLIHGVPYANSLTAQSSQNFIVHVPQWATHATNVLLFATNRVDASGAPVSVLIDGNGFPNPLFSPVLIGPGSNGVAVLSTNTTFALTPGSTYYLTVTNPLPVAVTFGLGVWFDLTTLTNCQPHLSDVGPAGIPRYFQVDVPPGGDPAQNLVFWLTGVTTNVTLVTSRTLPLPDLTRHDYISKANGTNDELLMVLPRTTPYGLKSGRYYVGVFNSGSTNVPFTIQACYSTTAGNPTIIPLTNGVPFEAALVTPFAAPPGPPQAFFFEFEVTNQVSAVLFELYNLSGNVDLVLQKYLPSGSAPYYRVSQRLGLTNEQIVLRSSYSSIDLRGKYYLGVYNRESTNVGYTVRAAIPDDGVLDSALPLRLTMQPALSPRGVVMSWNAVEGEVYVVDFATSLWPPNWIRVAGPFVAPSPCPAIEVPVYATGAGFYRVNHVSRAILFSATLTIKFSGDTVRISWPIDYPNLRLEFAAGLGNPWQVLNLPVVIEGNEFVVYDTLGASPRFYRLAP